MHVLEQRIAEVGRRARRLLALYGLSCVFTMLVAATVGLATVDYLFKFEDHGIRLICSLTLLGIVGWAAYRFLWKNVRRRFTDVTLAESVERQFPELGDRLSTTIEFLKQADNDTFAGSAALRRAVIVKTTGETDSLDFLKSLETRPTRSALQRAAIVSLAAAALAVAWPSYAWIAVARLTRPFGSDAWPRRYNLQIENPTTHLAVGQNFEVTVTDLNGRVPDEAYIHYRYEAADGGNGDEQTERLQPLNDVLVARRDNVSRPFSYRVTGGDDHSMDWVRLEVVEPPRVESLKITLRPPAYTGWPVVASDRNIQALRGTRVELAAKVTKRLKSAELVQANGTSVAARLGNDGLSLTVPADPAQPFVIDKSGPYWLKMIDDEGLEGGSQDRGEIRAIADTPPSITIEQPTTNQFVTPEAEVPLKLLAKDDLAVREVTLHATRTANEQDITVPLFEGPKVPLLAMQTSAVPQQGESQSIDFVWQLAPLQLAPGTQLAFHAVASDYLPQTGKSSERRITIITAAELEDRIAQRQALILGELGRVLKLQQDTRTQVGDLQIQLDKVGRLAKQDIDHAQGAELNQRAVNRTLASESEGLPAQIHDLLSELQANKLDNFDIERRMQGMLDELKRLDQEHLAATERELTSVIKGGQAELGAKGLDKSAPSNRSQTPVSKAIASTTGHQEAVIRSLETMMGELSQWDSYRRFGREISQLRRDQEEVAEQTQKAGEATFGRQRKDLTAQQLADLNKLAERERELARRFDKVQQQMAEMARQLEESDPVAAATLEDASQAAQDRSVSGRMREGAQKIDDNQVGQAQQDQQQVARDFDELLDILANRREQELARLVKRLREAEGELETLRKQQSGLRKQMKAAEKIEKPNERRQQLERLSRQEKQLQSAAGRLARKLERLQAEKAGHSTRGAASKMAKSGAAGQQDDAAEAGDQAEQAQKDLDEAQQQLAERRRQAEADLAREQIAKMQDGIKSLRDRQQTLLTETERLDTLRTAQGRFTRSQLASVRDLARTQHGLKGESDSLAEKVAAAEVFKLALNTIGDEMAQAATAIEAQETGTTAQSLEKRALDRLDQMLAALKSSSQPKKDTQGGQGGGKSEAQDSVRPLAELKLLKLMQEDLNARFVRLAEKDIKASAQARTAEAAKLSAEQGKLAEMTQNFARPAAEDPEDDPESLPDFRLDKTPEEQK